MAVIGGALMLAGGIFALSMLSLWNTQMMGMMMPSGLGGQMMMGGSGGWGMTMMVPDGAGFMWWAVGTLSAISVGAGAVSVAGGLAIHRKPASAGVWGIGILVASIVGLVSMSGFFIGPILGIIAGILALAKK
jgi:hypothetical protein